MAYTYRGQWPEMGKITNFGDLADQDQDHEKMWSWRSRSDQQHSCDLEEQDRDLQDHFPRSLSRSLLNLMKKLYYLKYKVLNCWLLFKSILHICTS